MVRYGGYCLQCKRKKNFVYHHSLLLSFLNFCLMTLHPIESAGQQQIKAILLNKLSISIILYRHVRYGGYWLQCKRKKNFVYHHSLLLSFLNFNQLVRYGDYRLIAMLVTRRLPSNPPVYQRRISRFNALLLLLLLVTNVWITFNHVTWKCLQVCMSEREREREREIIIWYSDRFRDYM